MILHFSNLLVSIVIVSAMYKYRSVALRSFENAEGETNGTTRIVGRVVKQRFVMPANINTTRQGSYV